MPNLMYPFHVAKVRDGAMQAAAAGATREEIVQAVESMGVHAEGWYAEIMAAAVEGFQKGVPA